MAGGALLKREIIEEDAGGVDGVPLPSTFFVVPLFLLFLPSDKLIPGLLIPEDPASAMTKLQSLYKAEATSFRPYFLILRLYLVLHSLSVTL